LGGKGGRIYPGAILLGAGMRSQTMQKGKEKRNKMISGGFRREKGCKEVLNHWGGDGSGGG